MSKKNDTKHDIDWKYGKMLSAWYNWKYKWCNTKFKKEEMIRLKQHLIGGYFDVAMYQEYPQEIQQLS